MSSIDAKTVGWIAFLPYLTFIALPAGYLTLCVYMVRKRAWWYTYLAYYFIFGSIGGWLCAYEVYAFVPWLFSFVPAFFLWIFIFIAGVSGCAVSSVILFFRKRDDPIERGALLGGYLCLVSQWALFIYVINKA